MTTRAKAASSASSGYAKRVEDLSSLFEGLEGVDGEHDPEADASGSPVEIPIDEIEEDPDQPRKTFGEAALQELAASIRERGVLQAIVVRPKGEGAKHRIRYGARRWRAARLAGLSAIKAVIRDQSDDGDPYDQMIENIQRDDLSAPEIAAFVASRLAGGESQADVARRLGKDKSYVAVHAAVSDMPEELRAKLDAGAPIRGVYELFQAWKKHPEAVLAFCAERGTFTRAEALALVKALKNPAPGPSDAGRPPDATAQTGTAGTAHASERLQVRDRAAPVAGRDVAASAAPGEASGKASPPAGHRPAAKALLPTVIVKHRQRLGRLLLDRFPGQGPRFGLVQFEDDQEPAEVPLSELRLAELIGLD
jgi:ParB family transcriptional regulator, chromosome partitioning protein